MDWFNNMGVYLDLFPQTPAFAVDMATMPTLSAERNGFYMAYHMQNAPETFDMYPEPGPFGE